MKPSLTSTVTWLPALSTSITSAANPHAATISSPSSNDDNDPAVSSSDEGAPEALGASNSDKRKTPLLNGKFLQPPVPKPMVVPANDSPKLSPLSPTLSPSRLRDDPTAFHTLGSREEAEEKNSGNDEGITFHRAPSEEEEEEREHALRQTNAEAFARYYRRYYRRYLLRYSKQRQHRKTKAYK